MSIIIVMQSQYGYMDNVLWYIYKLELIITDIHLLESRLKCLQNLKYCLFG